jgi:hypothetical protein
MNGSARRRMIRVRLFAAAVGIRLAAGVSMASAEQLTTIDGLTVAFDRDRVALLQMEPSPVSVAGEAPRLTGPLRTSVYGIVLPGPLIIAETIPAFLARLKLTDEFAQLTAPNGTAIWVRANHVAYVRSKTAFDHAAAEVGAYIGMGARERAIRESVEKARSAINEHGGKL